MTTKYRSYELYERSMVDWGTGQDRRYWIGFPPLRLTHFPYLFSKKSEEHLREMIDVVWSIPSELRPPRNQNNEWNAILKPRVGTASGNRRSKVKSTQTKEK